MTERVQTHEIAVYVTSGHGTEDLSLPGEEPKLQQYVWASSTDGTGTGYHQVRYVHESCDPFPEIKHHLRQRAMYEAIRQLLKEVDPAP